MASHAPVQLISRAPQPQPSVITARRTPNHHHLPPLLMPPRLTLATEMNPTFVRRVTPSHSTLRSPSVSQQCSSSLRNCCSVSTVGPGTDTDQHSGNGHAWKDAVSYAVQHQLPSLLNDMVNDLLRERPESDVEKWMIHWFERVYERRQHESERRLTQRCELSQPPGRDPGNVLPPRPPPLKGHSVASLPPVAMSHTVSTGSEDQPQIAPCSTSPGSAHYTVVVHSPMHTGSAYSPKTPVETNSEPLSAPASTTVRTTLAQCPLPQTSLEARMQSVLEDVPTQPIVVRLPRAMEYRRKS